MGPSEGNPPVTGGFPSQGTSNVENVSISLLHHECIGWMYRSICMQFFSSDCDVKSGRVSPQVSPSRPKSAKFVHAVVIKKNIVVINNCRETYVKRLTRLVTPPIAIRLGLTTPSLKLNHSRLLASKVGRHHVSPWCDWAPPYVSP